MPDVNIETPDWHRQMERILEELRLRLHGVQGKPQQCTLCGLVLPTVRAATETPYLPAVVLSHPDQRFVGKTMRS